MTRKQQIETAARVEYPREIRWTDMGDEDWNLPGYNAFIVGAEWADKTMIDKAVAWLEQNADRYIYNAGMGDDFAPKMAGSMYEDFRKAMESGDNIRE